MKGRDDFTLSIDVLRQTLKRGNLPSIFQILYPSLPSENVRERYLSALSEFAALYGSNREIILTSAPGRTEIGGNHTDHQHGNVLAAAIDLDILCVVSPRKDKCVRLQSEGFSPIDLDLSNLSANPKDNDSAKLIRGCANWLAQHGW